MPSRRDGRTPTHNMLSLSHTHAGCVFLTRPNPCVPPYLCAPAGCAPRRARARNDCVGRCGHARTRRARREGEGEARRRRGDSSAVGGARRGLVESAWTQRFSLSSSRCSKLAFVNIVGDFGISKVLESTTQVAMTVVGTPYYMAPESCQSDPYTSKTDVWALGIILYELCALK